MEVRRVSGYKRETEEVLGLVRDRWDEYVTGYWEDHWPQEGEVFVAEQDSDLVGVVRVVASGDGAWFEGLSLGESRRAKRGEIGSRLLGEAVDFSRESGADVLRGVVLDSHKGSVDSLEGEGFERVAELRRGWGFGFPYESDLEDAHFDQSLEYLRETEGYGLTSGLYVNDRLRVREIPQRVEELGEDARVLALGHEDDIPAVVISSGVRENKAGETSREELVMGFVWSQPQHISDVALYIRGEVNERDLDDAIVFLPAVDEYTSSFVESGYEFSEGVLCVYELELEE
ncbi:MAG: GNAT family N-acetyltransferase [Halobacteria archaeon]|nr:GNAT family N-acetyltransferase [Halobacteria archaeon]